MIKEIFDKNPQEKERFKNGEKKLTGFFIGQIMKASNGTADPKKINKSINQPINQLKMKKVISILLILVIISCKGEKGSINNDNNYFFRIYSTNRSVYLFI